MAVVVKLRCPGCGRDCLPSRFRLTDEGAYEGGVHELSLRVDHIGGRGRLRVDRQPLPLNMARGLRDLLRAALENIDAEIAQAESV